MAESDVLQGVQAVVMDMDGVLWRGDTPLPGLHEFFEFLHQRSLPFILATNNSTKTVEAYVRTLARFGIAIGPEHIVTSAVATAEYLRATYPGQALRTHLVGESGLFEIMLEAGYAQVMADADVVIVGMDRDLTYAKIRTASTLIRQGARFIGTNGDRTFPMPDGLAPGSGSMLAAIEAAAGQAPFIIGKPEPVMFEMALARLGVTASQALMIGDRLETDILGGQQAGLITVLVRSGVTSPEALAASSVKPDLIFDGLPDLRAAWLEPLDNAGG
jgi:4-nitrophenyl phosphatase